MKKLFQLLTAVSLLLSTSLHAASVTINPTKDGFVQQSGDSYVDNFQNMNLKNQSSYNREIFLDYDLTNVVFTPKHAILKLYVNSVDNSTPFIVTAYSKTGNVIVEGFKYTTRPTTGQYKTADIHAAQDSVGKWLVFDFSDFIGAQDFSENKLLYFRIVVTAPATSPLITIGSIESANKPQLVLSDAPMAGVSEIPFAEIEAFYSSAPFVAAGDPVHAFNGAGLLPGMKHETAGDNKAWRNSSGSYPIKLMAKLKSPSHITRLHVWNMNWLFGTTNTDYTGRGVKDLDIYVSSSADDMTVVEFDDSRWVKVSADEFHLTIAAGSSTYGGEMVNISGADNSRWIAFNILSNFESTTYVGLSEVKIYKSAIPEQYKWSGSSGGSWTDPASWTPNRLTLYDSDVLSFTGSGEQTVNNVPTQTLERLKVQSGRFIFKNSGTLSLGNLEVLAGAGAEFAPDAGSTVNVSEDVIIGAAGNLANRINNTLAVTGNLTLESSENGTATLVNDGILTVSGTTTVQQYLTTKSGETNSDNWWYISSPVTGATSASILVDGYNNKFGYYNEPAANYQQIPATNVNLDAGQGYLAQINTTGTYEFTGTLNNGNVGPISLTRTIAVGGPRGFNLIGNPYPSHIDWNAITGFGTQSARTDIRPTVWVRTRTASGAMDFDTWDGEDAVTKGKSGAMNGFIAPMQAFWVKVHEDNTSPTITFTNAMRSGRDQSTADNRLRAPAVSNRQILRLELNNGLNFDQTVISTNALAQNGYDFYDSDKMSAGNSAIPEIYSLVAGRELVIDKRNTISEGTTAMLGFRPGQAGAFSIMATEMMNIENMKVILKDNVLNTETELLLNESYSFTADATATTNRFSVEFRAPEATTSVKDVNAANTLVFVNVANQIAVQSAALTSADRILVFNPAGQQLASQQANGQVTFINEKFNAGVYLVKVNNHLQKVIVK